MKVPVWIHRPDGTKRRGWLRREHTCTRACLRSEGRFTWCARYSYRAENE